MTKIKHPYKYTALLPGKAFLFPPRQPHCDLLHVLRCTARRVASPSLPELSGANCEPPLQDQDLHLDQSFLRIFDLIRFGCQVSYRSSHMCHKRLVQCSGISVSYLRFPPNNFCAVALDGRSLSCQLGLAGQQTLARSADLIFSQGM